MEFINSIGKDISESIGENNLPEENNEIQIIENKSNKKYNKNEDSAFYYIVSVDWLKKFLVKKD